MILSWFDGAQEQSLFPTPASAVGLVRLWVNDMGFKKYYSSSAFIQLQVVAENSSEWVWDYCQWTYAAEMVGQCNLSPVGIRIQCFLLTLKMFIPCAHEFWSPHWHKSNKLAYPFYRTEKSSDNLVLAVKWIVLEKQIQTLVQKLKNKLIEMCGSCLLSFFQSCTLLRVCRCACLLSFTIHDWTNTRTRKCWKQYGCRGVWSEFLFANTIFSTALQIVLRSNWTSDHNANLKTSEQWRLSYCGTQDSFGRLFSHPRLQIGSGF